MLESSRPTIHPVGQPVHDPAVPMSPEFQRPILIRSSDTVADTPGMSGTPAGFVLRICQAAFAAASLSILATVDDSHYVTPFYYLAFGVAVQCLWSISLVMVDVHAFLVRRGVRNRKLVTFFTIGDGITLALTFATACASAGITIFIPSHRCPSNHCPRLALTAAMAFLSSLAVVPCFVLNFWAVSSEPGEG